MPLPNTLKPLAYLATCLSFATSLKTQTSNVEEDTELMYSVPITRFNGLGTIEVSFGTPLQSKA